MAAISETMISFFFVRSRLLGRWSMAINQNLSEPHRWCWFSMKQQNPLHRHMCTFQSCNLEKYAWFLKENKWHVVCGHGKGVWQCNPGDLLTQPGSMWFFSPSFQSTRISSGDPFGRCGWHQDGSDDRAAEKPERVLPGLQDVVVEKDDKVCSTQGLFL